MKVHPVYSTQEVLQLTYDLTKQVLEVEGDLIECGVAAGSQIGAMQQCLIDHNVIKSVYGYDSFQGIPYATNDDADQPGLGAVNQNKLGALETTGVSSNSRRDVIENFAKWGLTTTNLYLIEGWFQNTIPKAEHNKIALLRLDGDLYESTKVCLTLLPKLQKGGIMIIDDWGLPGCRKAILEVLKLKDIKETLGIAYYIKK
jgi:hypothetical protein